MITVQSQERHTRCRLCGAQAVWFGTKEGYDLFDCLSCRFLFVAPIPANLAGIYAETYFRNPTGTKDTCGYTDYDKDKEPMRHIFALYIAKLALLTHGRSIFDFGAATGYFLDIAQHAGWRTFGSEISRYARSESERRGHQMCGGMVSDIPSDWRVAAVTMWDVLEHVDDPRAFVRAAHGLLEPDGVLAINTVDRSSVWARLFGLRWHLIVPPEHLNFFSRSNLTKLLDDEGFEVLEIRKIGKSFSPAYIFKMLASWQKLRFWEWCARMTDNRYFRLFAIPINLRDNVFLLARKRTSA